MDNATRTEIAESLERLADQNEWDLDVWQQCYRLVATNWDNEELLQFAYGDIIHYSELLQSLNGSGFQAKPGIQEIEDYRYELRSVAAALRSSMSLSEARRIYGL